jgi:phosphoadenosine phosphosulfate reductase
MLSSEVIQRIEDSSLPEAIQLVAELFPGKVVFSSSLGQEDQVITDAIFKNNIDVKIFTLDTGRLFNETYELLDRTTARYKKDIKIYFPESGDVEEFVTTKGINSFYESVENRKSCCFIRKVKPLNRALEGAKVWMTGLRAEQSENRHDMPMIEWSEEKQLYKFNPLIRWTYDLTITNPDIAGLSIHSVHRVVDVTTANYG